jgi:hypothetical protein
MASGLNFTLVRIKEDAADDPDPNDTAPQETDCFHVPEYMDTVRQKPSDGFVAYLSFDDPVGNVADVQVYIRDESRRSENVWIDAGSRSALVHLRGFEEPRLFNATVYFRITGITAGEPVSVYAAPL